MTLGHDGVSSAQLHDVADHTAALMTRTRLWSPLSCSRPRLGPARGTISSHLNHVIAVAE